MATIIWWASAAFVAYAYVVYPLIVGLVARVRPRPVRRGGAGDVSSLSLVIAARNEQARIVRRLNEACAQVRRTGLPGEVLLVSDGSSDATAELGRGVPGVRVIELMSHQGKAAALNRACAATTGEIVVFADARQTWEPDTLQRLLENFADPAVGAVSGDLVLEDGDGVLRGVGLYWRFEKWLRRNEAILHSTTGVTGAVSAMRRRLWRPIPAWTILDDLYWPLAVCMQGYRVVHDERARAHDRLPDRAPDEFWRKVRTLAGNFQILVRLPGALLPWRCPIAMQFLSHKVARLLVPWALLAMLACSALAMHRTMFLIAFVAETMVGVLALLGRRSKAGSIAASFLTLNAAAWVAFWVWASGRAEWSWRPVLYLEAGREPGERAGVEPRAVTA